MRQQLDSRPSPWPQAMPSPTPAIVSANSISLPKMTVQATWSSAGDPRRGHDYMHARFYSPQMARFFSVDPVGGDPKDPQSWNRYTYVTNNPLRYVDPTGELKRAGEIADDLDEGIDELEFTLSDQLQPTATGILLDTLLGTVADLSRGVTDVLRLGACTA